MQKLDEVLMQLNELELVDLYVIIECAQELIDSVEGDLDGNEAI